MSWILIIAILLLLPFILKGRWLRHITWPLTVIFAVLLIASPFVYYGTMKTKPVLSKATNERIDHDNRQMIQHMINEDVSKYEQYIVATKRFHVNAEEINIFGEASDMSVYYYVENTTDLTNTIEVTLYKRPFVKDGVTIGQTLTDPTITFEKDELQFVGQAPPPQHIYQVRTFSQNSAIASLSESKTYGVNPYFAYIRVPQKLRVYDVQGYRLQQGVMLDDD